MNANYYACEHRKSPGKQDERNFTVRYEAYIILSIEGLISIFIRLGGE